MQPHHHALDAIRQLHLDYKSHYLSQPDFESRLRDLLPGLCGLSPSAWEERCGLAELSSSAPREPWSQTMAFFESGTYKLGTSDKFNESFGSFFPPTSVHLTRPFWLKKTPVTQAEWRDIAGTSPSRFCGNPTHPVERVSWYDALAFCNALSQREGLPPAYLFEGVRGSIGSPDFLIDKVIWQRDSGGYRLPTEIEWEAAASGAWLSRQPNDLHGEAWTSINSPYQTQPVGQKKPTKTGCYDLLGNVWEWCYDASGGAIPKQPAPDYCHENGPERMMRGGSWFNSTGFAHPSCRLSYAPTHRYGDAGFRIARFA